MSAARRHTALTVASARGLAVLAGLLAIDAGAQETLEQQVLARCARIAEGNERLACYDAAARWIEAAQPSADAPAQPTENTSPAPSATPPAASFGLEQLGDAAVEEITSRIVGTFSGWRGNTRFTLANGQVWQQDEPGRGIYRSESPQVTIRRGAMGTFLMEIEGVRRSLRVRRVE